MSSKSGCVIRINETQEVGLKAQFHANVQIVAVEIRPCSFRSDCVILYPYLHHGYHGGVFLLPHIDLMKS